MGSISVDPGSKRPRDESTSDLLSGLLRDAKELVTAHGDHLKVEVRHEIRSLKETVIKAGIAVAAVVLAGLLLAHAIALGVAALGVPMWAAYGITALVFALAGYLVFRTRPSDLELVPKEAIGSIKRDVKRVKTALDTDSHGSNGHGNGRNGHH